MWYYVGRCLVFFFFGPGSPTITGNKIPPIKEKTLRVLWHHVTKSPHLDGPTSWPPYLLGISSLALFFFFTGGFAKGKVFISPIPDIEI